MSAATMKNLDMVEVDDAPMDIGCFQFFGDSLHVSGADTILHAQPVIRSPDYLTLFSGCNEP